MYVGQRTANYYLKRGLCRKQSREKGSVNHRFFTKSTAFFAKDRRRPPLSPLRKPQFGCPTRHFLCLDRHFHRLTRRFRKQIREKAV